MIKFDFKERADKICSSFICDDNKNILFFDIETTGLKASHSDLYMIGYGVISEPCLHITLLFNNDGRSEPEMLEYFSNVMSNHKMLVTYNGDTFDIPYMKEKYKQFGISSCLTDLESFDIYRKIRKYKSFLHLESMKQSDIEELMGIHRETFISGGELIKTYKEYLKTGDFTMQNELITHNRDDIYGLANITGILGIYLFFTGDFDVVSYELSSNKLSVILSVKMLPFRMSFLCKDIIFTGINNKMTVHIPYIEDTLKYYFNDYRNYYYLPLEDTAIHKSVGMYVDNEHKEKATKETAYVNKHGKFIRDYKNKSKNKFKKAFLDKESFLEIDDSFLSDNDNIKNYILNVLKK